jgi:ribosome-binding ATPase YchF (GTP1/OBG family)
MKSSDKEVFLERQFKTNIERNNYRTWKKAQRRRTRTRYIKKAIGIFSKTVDDLYFHQKKWKDISDWKDVQSIGWSKELLSMEKPVCFRENKELNLLKQNNFHLFWLKKEIRKSKNDCWIGF